MNFSCLCAIRQTDIFPFAFSYKLWNINVKKKWFLRKLLINFLPHFFHEAMIQFSS